jgi:hypothetical protein
MVRGNLLACGEYSRRFFCASIPLTRSALIADAPQTLQEWCARATPEWIDLMTGLRNIVHDARKDLSAALSKRFDDKVSLKALQEDLKTRRWSDSGLDLTNPSDAERIINALFEGRGIIDDDDGPDPIEVECFDKCIELLQQASKKMERDAKKTVIVEEESPVTSGQESRHSRSKKRRRRNRSQQHVA